MQIVLTGEVGTGKMTLINKLLEWLRLQQVATAFVFNSRMNVPQFLDYMMADFGIPCDSKSKSQILQRLYNWLLDRYRAGETAVLIVDEKADSRQREALVAMARSLGGERLKNVTAVKSARIAMKVEDHAKDAKAAHAKHGMPQAPRASFWAAGLAQIVTRPLDERDHACGNEDVAYPPLSKGVNALPAYTLGHLFKGEGLNENWNDPNCRSSFVGHFAL